MNDCINNGCSIDLCTLLLLLCCCNNGGNTFGNMGSCNCNLPLILLLTCCNGFGNSYCGCK